MTCTTPLPERLDPPDTASECAICHRVTEDGRDLDLCDEAVDTLHSAALVRLSARIPTGKQFVCETCLDDLHDAQERHRAEAFDTISDALGLDDCEHPALRAREVVQRLQSSPAPVGVEVRDWLTTSDVIEAFGSWEDSKPWAYIADDLNRIVASRLSSIKTGEVVVAIPDPTGIVVDLPERYRERGIELVRNAIQWAREHARIVPRAQATTSGGGTT